MSQNYILPSVSPCHKNVTPFNFALPPSPDTPQTKKDLWVIIVQINNFFNCAPVAKRFLVVCIFDMDDMAVCMYLYIRKYV